MQLRVFELKVYQSWRYNRVEGISADFLHVCIFQHRGGTTALLNEISNRWPFQGTSLRVNVSELKVYQSWRYIRDEGTVK